MPKNKEVLSTRAEVEEFLEAHSGEIMGLYRDSYYRYGGWNGMMGAIGEVEERHGVELDLDGLKDGEFEEIIEDWRDDVR